jgi:N-methylhydantoinase A
MGSGRIAVDIGGTFTDLVLVVDGRIAETGKVLTTPDDPSDAVETGVTQLLERYAPETIREIVHGTTLVSNALIERKGATTGLVTTRGFKDTITIRRELRYALYDLFIELPEPLVPRRLRWEVDERILADGTIDTPLDTAQIEALATEIEHEGVQALAVCLLHAYRNPIHERQVAEAFRELLPDVRVSISSDVSPEVGEYTRTSTVNANAYVLPLVDRYLEMLEKRFRSLGLRTPLRIMLSTGGGGLAGVETARRYPVRLLESGPAAGALSAGYWGARSGHRDVLAFDMGGTTAKACLIEDGVPMVAREFEAARVYRFTKGSGLPLRVPVIDLIEIGAGGGSIAHVGPFGTPNVGPESTGALPGPASYGLGGTEPTVTDADLLLGYLDPEFFLGGAMRLDVERASAVMERLGEELGMTAVDTAAAIHRVVNENMASAARIHAIERGRDLRRFALVATGGAGPVHAWGVARTLGINTLIFPRNAGVASAFGMLTANPGFEFARSLPSPLADVAWPEIRDVIDELAAEGTALLRESGVDASDVRIELAVDVRHRGQGDAITVELGTDFDSADPAGQVETAFGQAYVGLYGRRPPGVESEVMTWRVRVLGPLPEIDVRIEGDAAEGGRKGTRSVWFPESGFIQTVVYDRYSVGAGATIHGPAVLEERESTMVIGPGAVATVDDVGNLVVEVP